MSSLALFPGDGAGEVLRFLHYGPHATGGGAVLHTTFEDPSTAMNAAPRQSIELRTLVS